MRLTYRHTRNAWFVSYVTQAIVNNLSPLLFLTFQQQFSISLSQISLLITVNFAVQMLVDILSAHFIDRIGYRASITAAHALAVLGLCGLSFLPQLTAPYAGLLIATVLNAMGGGLLEVLVSPMVEALPSEHKEKEMSLLHSFYCWGHVAVVLLSTGYFLLFGTASWRCLPLLWALIPLFNALVFLKAPLCSLTEAGRDMPISALAKLPLFWLFLLLMVCSGASELAMSQWASLFAEEGLQVSKTMGDLLGPCCFALLMGLARFGFSRVRLPLAKTIQFSAILCAVSYAVTIFSPWPLLSLLGCAVCGFSVGVMWPGVYSLAVKKIPAGGTAMFAFLALAGDIGCCSGPSLAGAVSDSVMSGGPSLLFSLMPGIPLSQAALKTGFLAAMIFPVLLILGLCSQKVKEPRR